MKRLATGIILAALLLWSGTTLAQSWNASPNNWSNSPNNWENSPNNWKNNPNNWQNSPNRWANERIVRDNYGNPHGYAVPRQDGGVNFFDFDGNRRGYAPGF